MAWYEMPPPILRAYAAALPTVRAEESLAAIADGLAANQHIKRHTAQQRIRDLERAASAGQPRRPANLRRLRAAGIRIERHRKGGESPSPKA